MSIPILGIGVGEALLILVLTLLLVGPKRFPEVMRQVGRWYKIARGFTTEVMKDVRAAVDEIEEEINTETEDLRSVRDLADVRGEVERDLSDARREADQAGRETEQAANADRNGSSRAPSSSARPSKRTESGARSSNTKPATNRPSNRPSSRPPEPEPEPSPESDPFKALEARQAAAAREAERRGDADDETNPA